MEFACKQCGGTSFVKNGFVRNLQRYRCRTCGCNFTATPKRGRSIGIKALAIFLYRFGRFSYRKLGKLLGVSWVSVYKWVRQASEPLGSEIMEEIREMELDELCHFLCEKKTIIGLEKSMLVTHGVVSPELWLAVIMVKRRARPGCAGCPEAGAVYPHMVLSGQQVVRGTRGLGIIAPAHAVKDVAADEGPRQFPGQEKR